MDPAIEEFVEEVVMRPELEWVQWSVQKSTSRSTLDCKHGLLLKIVLRHPYTWRQDGTDPESNRTNGVPFDIERHTHSFELRVEDPTFRWGRRGILNISTEPGDEAYAFVKGIYERLGSAKPISTEHVFESKIATVGKALRELTYIPTV